MSKHGDLQSLKTFSAGDAFNYNHRHEAGYDRHWSSDIDLVLTERDPNPHISAFLEFKNVSEPIRFTQAVIFKTLQSIAPCFIVTAEHDMLETDLEDQTFSVERFDGIEDLSPTPPKLDTTEILSDVSWGGFVDNSKFAVQSSGEELKRGFVEWEDELRWQSKQFRRGEHL